jgi:hypothetical protein
MKYKNIFAALKVVFYGYSVCRAVKYVEQRSSDWECLLQSGCQVTFCLRGLHRVLRKNVTALPYSAGSFKQQHGKSVCRGGEVE